MKNKTLYPLLSVLIMIIILAILTTNPIPLSPLMLTVIVLSYYITGLIYHMHKSTITKENIIELSMLAFIVQFVAISFL